METHSEQSLNPTNLEYPIKKSKRFLTIVSFIFLYFCGYFGCIFLYGPVLPLALFAPKLFYFYIECLLTLWIMLSEILLGGVLGVRVRQFGDHFITPELVNNAQGRVHSPVSPLSGLNLIMIMNHRTRYDWFFIWCLGRPIRFLKAVLKYELAAIPGVGWAAQAASYIFLKRRIAIDEARIKQTVKYLRHISGKVQILMFPEGTNLTTESISRSDSYAVKTERPLLRYTLHPRHTGFLHFVEALLPDLSYVYDITVAYPFTMSTGDLSLIFGKLPQEVHYLVRRWPISSLPLPRTSGISDSTIVPLSDETKKELGDWLDEQWLEKEKILKQYYHAPPEERRFSNEILCQDVLIGRDGKFSIQACVMLGFWAIFSLVVLMLLTYRLVLVYLIIMNCLFVALWWCHGGVGTWAAHCAGFSLPNDIQDEGRSTTSSLEKKNT